MSSRQRKLAMRRGGAPCPAAAGKRCGFFLLGWFERSIWPVLVYCSAGGRDVSSDMVSAGFAVASVIFSSPANRRKPVGRRAVSGWENLKTRRNGVAKHRAADLDTPATGFLTIVRHLLGWGMAERERTAPMDQMAGRPACRNCPLSSLSRQPAQGRRGSPAARTATGGGHLAKSAHPDCRPGAGLRVHESGCLSTMPRANRLRQWLNVDRPTFYDPDRSPSYPWVSVSPGTDDKGATCRRGANAPRTGGSG